MDDCGAKILSAALPRLRGRLVRAAKASGSAPLVIGYGISDSLVNDRLIEEARDIGLHDFQPFSIEHLCADENAVGSMDWERLRFPACFFDRKTGIIVVAGNADKVGALLQHFHAVVPRRLRAMCRKDVDLSGPDVDAEGVVGKIVAVTGAASGIGLEIVRTFDAAGAIVIALDINEQGLASLVERVGCLALVCDVTNQMEVDRSFETIAAEVGGLDILVCNAGYAWQAPIGDVLMDDLQKSFDLNFFGHQRVAQAAVRIFRYQKIGGLILFNISNQSVNLGRDFGPYGLAKAAEFALMKQYALDHGHEGIRTNGVNAGRIRTGLMTDEMIEARAMARGISPVEYMAGNLLGVEVTSSDVAKAFLHLALMDKVNAAVLTIDGGLMATSLR